MVIRRSVVQKRTVTLSEDAQGRIQWQGSEEMEETLEFEWLPREHTRNGSNGWWKRCTRNPAAYIISGLVICFQMFADVLDVLGAIAALLG